MRAVDLHAANLIANGTQPVLIDCETLLHPETRLPRTIRRRAIDVLRTGLLPVGNSGMAEISAFGRLLPGHHLLQLNGVAAPARDFADSIAAGFDAMHRLLRKRVNGLRRVTDKLQPALSRRIYCPTSLYAAILFRSYAPGMMESGLKRSLALLQGCRDSAIPRAGLSGELDALENGDIPIFFGPPARARQPLSSRGLQRSVPLLKSALIRPSL